MKYYCPAFFEHAKLPTGNVSPSFCLHECTCILKLLSTVQQFCHSYNSLKVLHGSVVKCLTHNPENPGSRHTGSSGCFCGSVLGQDTSEPQPSTGETQGRHEFVSCCCNMTEILLNLSINQSINTTSLFLQYSPAVLCSLPKTLALDRHHHLRLNHICLSAKAFFFRTVKTQDCVVKTDCMVVRLTAWCLRILTEQGIDTEPPVLKSATLPTELWGLACGKELQHVSPLILAHCLPNIFPPS